MAELIVPMSTSTSRSDDRTVFMVLSCKRVPQSHFAVRTHGLLCSVRLPRSHPRISKAAAIRRWSALLSRPGSIRSAFSATSATVHSVRLAYAARGGFVLDGSPEPISDGLFPGVRLASGLLLRHDELLLEVAIWPPLLTGAIGVDGLGK